MLRRLALATLGVGTGAAVVDPQGAVRAPLRTPDSCVSAYTCADPTLVHACAAQRAAAACVPRTSRALATFALVAADFKFWSITAAPPARAEALDKVRTSGNMVQRYAAVRCAYA
jgi:hypothetical protein